MKIFYMERGGSVSNCFMKFNLPVTPTGGVAVSKEAVEINGADDTALPAAVFEFQISTQDNSTDDSYLPLASANYKVFDIYASTPSSGTTDGDGKFTLKSGQTAYFEIPENYNVNVTETKAKITDYEWISTTVNGSDGFTATQLTVAGEDTQVIFDFVNNYKFLYKELSIDKSADVSTYDAVDDVITYSYVVRNTGNLTLSNVTVEDDNIDAGSLDPASVATLAPGAEVTFTATRTITQTDLDAGEVVNVAYATDGTTDSPTDTETVTTDEKPALTIDKSADVSTYDAVDDVITYTITVENTGNVTLYDVLVTDPLTGLNVTIASLAPEATEEYTQTYTIEQKDLDAGRVLNTATATDGTTSDSDDETVTADKKPALDVTKTADPTSYDAVGDVITYTITVKNTGNVTLYDVVVTDPLTGLNETITSLAPDATESYTQTYTIKQGDLDAGSVLNTATATAGEISDSDDETVTADKTPALRIDKRADKTTYNAVGEVISYTFEVENTGNVTLYDVYVVDNKVNTSPDKVETLAPGATATFTASYTITQDDVDNNAVITNVAYATDGTTNSNNDSWTVTEYPKGCLTIVKEWEEVS